MTSFDSDADRKAREVAFHDQRERDRRTLSDEEFLARYPNKRFYFRATAHKKFLDQQIAAFAPGSDVLDYCCGTGGQTIDLARAGGNAVGVDISPESIASASAHAEQIEPALRPMFHVMDAENLEFDDDSFDLIVCSGVLHHLNVSAAYAELRRVLRPGGRVVCLEALAHNPFIRFYRRLTPRLRTEWEANHILSMKEVELASEYFEETEIRFFYLLSILGLVLPSGRIGDAVTRGLLRVDQLLLRAPIVQLLAWQIVFVLRVPRKR